MAIVFTDRHKTARLPFGEMAAAVDIASDICRT
jgi:hypothetical protein